MIEVIRDHNIVKNEVTGKVKLVFAQLSRNKFDNQYKI